VFDHYIEDCVLPAYVILPPNLTGSVLTTAQVTGFCRRTPFKLPEDPSTPVIMVGAGTGLAPLRGMYLHLEHLRQSGAKLGENMLVFGCRCVVRYLSG
jgi:sulfite reductase alpha subunit-like flavoprotein